MACDVDLGTTYLYDTSGFFRFYAVLLLAMGRNVQSRDVHKAWVQWVLDRDFCHDALATFAELPEDAEFADALGCIICGRDKGRGRLLRKSRCVIQQTQFRLMQRS